MIYEGWKLDFTDKYVFGTDKKLYKKPYVSARGHHLELREMKLIERETKGYWLDYRGKVEWWSLNQLYAHLEKVKEGKLLKELKETPFEK